MILLPLVVAATIGLQAPATPAVDRSGEPALRKLLEWASKLDDVHIVVMQFARGSKSEPMYPGSRVDLWLEGKKFRLETSGYWGDGSYVVADGTAVLKDTCSEYEDALVSEEKGSVLETLKSVDQSVDDLSPFFWLLNAPEHIDKAAPKEAKVTASGDLVTISHKTMGDVKFHVVGGEVDRIEYDNEPELERLAKEDPEFADAPNSGGLTRHIIYISHDRPPANFFSTVPAKGRAFTDRRKTKKTG